MKRPTKPTAETAEETFLARIFEAREILDKLVEHIDDHLGVDPESLHWGHVGDVGRVVELLRQAVEVVDGAGRDQGLAIGVGR